MRRQGQRQQKTRFESTIDVMQLQDEYLFRVAKKQLSEYENVQRLR